MASADTAVMTLEKHASRAHLVRFSVRVGGGAEPAGFQLSAGSRQSGTRGQAGTVGGDGAIGHQWHVYEADLQDGLERCRRIFVGRALRFETLEVRTTRSKLSAKELRPFVMAALSEVFGDPLPDDATSKGLLEAHELELQAEKVVRQERKARVEKLARKREKKARAARRPKTAVTDIPSFLTGLSARISDPGRIQKATKMLKKTGFELYNDVAEDHVIGVVKSQTDRNLVYACRLGSDGEYCCCTQNLNMCGGLRGKACKHMIVLLIGLVQAGDLDPVLVDGWLDEHIGRKPKLDRDRMGDIFLKYKGAEAGDVDWRPTETVPEDFYAY